MWLAPEDRKAADSLHFDQVYRNGSQWGDDPGIIGRAQEQLWLTGDIVGKSILDLGGGATLAPHVGAAKDYLLVDFSQEVCRAVSERFGNCRTLASGAMEFLRANEERFDVVCSFGMFEYLPPTALAEVFALCPSDVFCLGTPSAEGYLQYDTRVTIYSVDDVRRISESAGWRNVRQHPFPSHVWARYERVKA